jgi:hypothetical protein
VTTALTFTSVNAKKPTPPPPDDSLEDMPACVDVTPMAPEDCADHGGLGSCPGHICPDVVFEGVDYCHLGRKEGVLMGIWGDSGRFDMVTNNKEREGGRTMLFYFPISDPAPQGVEFEGLGVPPTTPIVPLGVGIVTARENVVDYAHLLAMEIGEERPIALRIRLVLADNAGHYDLNYGDILFNEGDENRDPLMAVSDLVLARRLDNQDGKRRWEICSSGEHKAYVRRISSPDFEWIPVGVYTMPLRLEIVEQ